MYVVLDLQPGRANFLDQAKLYEPLLRLPHVGLALDPEWRLGPTSCRCSRSAAPRRREINSVYRWLPTSPRSTGCRRSCSSSTSSGCR